VAGAVVIGADEGAKAANIWYWERGRPLFAAVADRLATCPDERLRVAADRLRRDPADPARYARLHGLVAEGLHTSPDLLAPIVEVAWTVRTRSRLSHHAGADYRPRPDLPLTELEAAARAAEPAPAGGAPDVLVVVPFADRGEDGWRSRNLLACLLALRDQSLPRDRYRVTVVESDSRPRWRERLARYADEYLFAEKAGPFNKCWTVNVGVEHAAWPAELVCVLDADALVDTDFLARNLRRLRQRPEAGACLPYSDLLYLDAAASAQAIDDRCRRRLSDVDRSRLRGFLVHRGQGVCVWLRRDVFHDIGGLDERHEGWGKEDMDLLLRLQLATALFQFDDQMLHLHHPPAYRLDGNSHIPWLSWPPDAPIGRLDRFAGITDG
jgi:hypothetical protein